MAVAAVNTYMSGPVAVMVLPAPAPATLAGPTWPVPTVDLNGNPLPPWVKFTVRPSGTAHADSFAGCVVVDWLSPSMLAAIAAGLTIPPLPGVVIWPWQMVAFPTSGPYEIA